MARELFPFRDSSRALKVKTITMLARCRNVVSKEYNYKITMTCQSSASQPATQVDMTLTRAGHLYGDLYVSRKDVATLTPRIQVAPADPAVTWHLKMMQLQQLVWEEPSRNSPQTTSWRSKMCCWCWAMSWAEAVE